MSIQVDGPVWTDAAGAEKPALVSAMPMVTTAVEPTAVPPTAVPAMPSASARVPGRASMVALMSVLIGAVALPSLGIDMYLASLPEIREVFGVPVGISQLTLTLFMLMLGIGQLVGGAVSDAVGRRRPLILGLALFVTGSVLAALALGITLLLVARVLQGAGGALAVVVANSTVRDVAVGDAATRLYALLLGISGIAPVIAPTLGGVVDAALGWRAVFWVLALLGTVLLLLALARLPETLVPERRSPLRPRAVASAFAGLLRTPRFLAPGAALISMLALLFAYIGGASYVYQGGFGLDARQFGLAFGAAGVAMMLSTLAVHRLASRVATLRLGLAGAVLAGCGAVGALVVALAGGGFGLFLAALIVLALGFGMAEPAAMGSAMDAADGGAGQAAALLGTAQYLVGGGVSVLAGAAGAAGAVAWTAMLVLLAAAGVGLTAISLRAQHR